MLIPEKNLTFEYWAMDEAPLHATQTIAIIEMILLYAKRVRLFYLALGTPTDLTSKCVSVQH